MARRISLTRGKFALVSDEDYDRLNQYNWSCDRQGYACRQGPRQGNRRTLVLMHRFILDAPTGLQVDHINGDTLDNRRDNLRICTHLENVMNRPGRGGTSKYKGVFYDKRRDRYYARHGGKHIGSFRSEDDAARAYDDHVRALHGDYAWLNFPDSDQFDRAKYEAATPAPGSGGNRRRPSRESNKRAKRVTVQCDWCGADLVRTEHYANRYAHVFCNKSCWASFANTQRANDRQAQKRTSRHD